MRQIQCDQCGRLLAPSEATTIICPSCGYAAIVPAQTIASAGAELEDGATRPVPTAVLPPAPTAAPAPLPEQERPTSPPPPPPVTMSTQAAAPLGAYAPASLPRSRADTPAEPVPPGHDQPQDGPHAMPAELLRGRDPLNDTRPADGALVEAAKGTRRAPLTVLSAIALVIVLALGTGAALLAANGRLNQLVAPFQPSPVPTAQPTATPGPPPAPAGFTRFTAADGTYTLGVPDGWTQVTQGKLTIFASTQDHANFEIQALAGQLDPQTAAGSFLTQLGPLLSGTSGTAQLGPLTRDTTQAAGSVWDRTAADLTVTASGAATSWHAVVLVTQHDGTTLVVAYFSPSSLFAEEQTTHFQVMLDTLLLLSPRP